MLGKCIKHEWKAMWKSLTVINAAALIMGLIGCGGCMALNREINIPDLAVGLYIISYVLILMAAVFATQFLMIQRYYQNFFTDEGYLTHTLPVTGHEKLISKLVVFVIWYLIDLVCIIGSVAILLFPFYSINFSDVNFGAFLTLTARTLGFPHPAFLVLYAIAAFLASIAYNILSYYFCISLGSLFPSHRVLASILIYIAHSILIQIVSGFGMIRISKSSTFSDELHMVIDGMDISYHVLEQAPMDLAAYLIFLLLGCAVSYAVSYYIIERRLNLQ